MKKSEIPLLAQVSLVNPGCIFRSKNLIRSRNKARSSADNAAIILLKTFQTSSTRSRLAWADKIMYNTFLKML